jgi:hypothetical protein
MNFLEGRKPRKNVSSNFEVPLFASEKCQFIKKKKASIFKGDETRAI